MPVGAIWRRGHKPKVPIGVAYIAVLKDFVLEKRRNHSNRYPG